MQISLQDQGQPNQLIPKQAINLQEGFENIVPEEKFKKGLQRNKRKKGIEKSTGMRFGGWNNSENLKYIKFLQKFSTIIEDEQLRRKKKIFHKMSQTIRTRTADQCRGHHQKFLQRFRTVDEIIKSMLKIIQENMIVRNFSKGKDKNLDKTAATYTPSPQIKNQSQKISISIPQQSIKEW